MAIITTFCFLGRLIKLYRHILLIQKFLKIFRSNKKYVDKLLIIDKIIDSSIDNI
jgi:hypothetical protein